MMNVDLKTMNDDLKRYPERAATIAFSTDTNYRKAVRLADLMTELEGRYQIPMIGEERIAAFMARYPDIWRLYELIRNQRNGFDKADEEESI